MREFESLQASTTGHSYGLCGDRAGDVSASEGEEHAGQQAAEAGVQPYSESRQRQVSDN